MSILLFFCTTYRSSENDRARVKVDLHDVALGVDEHLGHLPLGQHLVDEVVPGDVAAAAAHGVQQAYDEGDDEEDPQALALQLLLLLAPFLLFWIWKQTIQVIKHK